MVRVEAILSDIQIIGDGVKLSALRTSIRGLQKASSHLDKEKHKAEHHFKKLIARHSGHNQCKKHRSIFCRLSNWSRHLFSDIYISPELQESMCHADTWEEYLRHGLNENMDMAYKPKALKSSDDLWHVSHHKFQKAARKVSKANKKLMGFERGFLSEDGLQGREWYKHLGVAPGKWLGK